MVRVMELKYTGTTVIVGGMLDLKTKSQNWVGFDTILQHSKYVGVKYV